MWHSKSVCGLFPKKSLINQTLSQGVPLCNRPGGGLTALAGRLPSLDKLAKQYLASGKVVRDDLVSQAKKIAADLNDKAAAIYLRTFDKLQENESYVAKELARIQKLLEKKTTLASKKVDELEIKQNGMFCCSSLPKPTLVRGFTQLRLLTFVLLLFLQCSMRSRPPRTKLKMSKNVSSKSSK